VTRALRWTLVIVLLAGALAVALWPRAGSTTAQPPSIDATRAATSPPSINQPGTNQVGLEQLRARAGLQPCPSPRASVTGRGPLFGLTLPCLGHPGTVDLAAALAGRPGLLNLWGPLCQPCTQELPALAAYAAEPGAVTVLGVEVQQLPEAALDEVAALGVHYPSVSDPDGRLRAALRAPPVIPLTYLVSADGQVQQLNPPEVMRSAEEVRAVVARYLGPGANG
jgi:thiol-disulfide isomerase/thioredoxin